MRAESSSKPKRASVSPFRHGRSESRTKKRTRDATADAQRRLGLTLVRLRKDRLLSQESAAALAGLHEKYLSRLERGLSNPTLSTLVAMSLAYKVTLAEMFSGEAT
jgi:DNA-binding XRE family transcriptional regulator